MTTESNIARGAPLRVKGGRSPAPAVPSGRLAALARSAWAPIAAKLAIGAVALVGLAALGGSAVAKPPTSSESASAVARSDVASSPPAPGAAAATALDAGGAAASDAASLPLPLPIPGTLPDGRIVLNGAAEDDLAKLPSVGPKRARAILALRQRLGRFRAIEDLLRVKGIGRKTLVRLRPLVVLDPPPIVDGGSSVGHL